MAKLELKYVMKKLKNGLSEEYERRKQILISKGKAFRDYFRKPSSLKISNEDTEIDFESENWKYVISLYYGFEKSLDDTTKYIEYEKSLKKGDELSNIENLETMKNNVIFITSIHTVEVVRIINNWFTTDGFNDDPLDINFINEIADDYLNEEEKIVLLTAYARHFASNPSIPMSQNIIFSEYDLEQDKSNRRHFASVIKKNGLVENATDYGVILNVLIYSGIPREYILKILENITTESFEQNPTIINHLDAYTTKICFKLGIFLPKLPKKQKKELPTTDEILDLIFQNHNFNLTNLPDIENLVDKYLADNKNPIDIDSNIIFDALVYKVKLATISSSFENGKITHQIVDMTTLNMLVDQGNFSFEKRVNFYRELMIASYEDNSVFTEIFDLPKELKEHFNSDGFLKEDGDEIRVKEILTELKYPQDIIDALVILSPKKVEENITIVEEVRVVEPKITKPFEKIEIFETPEQNEEPDFDIRRYLINEEIELYDRIKKFHNQNISSYYDLSANQRIIIDSLLSIIITDPRLRVHTYENTLPEYKHALIARDIERILKELKDLIDSYIEVEDSDYLKLIEIQFEEIKDILNLVEPKEETIENSPYHITFLHDREYSPIYDELHNRIGKGLFEDVSKLINKIRKGEGLTNRGTKLQAICYNDWNRVGAYYKILPNNEIIILSFIIPQSDKGHSGIYSYLKKPSINVMVSNLEEAIRNNDEEVKRGSIKVESEITGILAASEKHQKTFN